MAAILLSKQEKVECATSARLAIWRRCSCTIYSTVTCNRSVTTIVGELFECWLFSKYNLNLFYISKLLPVLHVSNDNSISFTYPPIPATFALLYTLRVGTFAADFTCFHNSLFSMRRTACSRKRRNLRKHIMDQMLPVLKRRYLHPVEKYPKQFCVHASAQNRRLIYGLSPLAFRLFPIVNSADLQFQNYFNTAAVARLIYI